MRETPTRQNSPVKVSNRISFFAKEGSTVEGEYLANIAVYVHVQWRQYSYRKGSLS